MTALGSIIRWMSGKTLNWILWAGALQEMFPVNRSAPIFMVS